MTTAKVGDGYVADDLLWARDAYGTAHLEIDPWGNLIVSPATLPHELAIAEIVRVLHGLGGTVAVLTGLGFRTPGGSGYLNVPDVLVVPTDVAQDAHDHLSVAPLVVVEVASPSTRTIDRTRKAADYERARAQAYLLVDLPGLAPVDVPTIEVRLSGGASAVHTAAFELAVYGQRVVLDPAALAPPAE